MSELVPKRLWQGLFKAWLNGVDVDVAAAAIRRQLNVGRGQLERQRTDFEREEQRVERVLAALLGQPSGLQGPSPAQMEAMRANAARARQAVAAHRSEANGQHQCRLPELTPAQRKPGLAFRCEECRQRWHLGADREWRRTAESPGVAVARAAQGR